MRISDWSSDVCSSDLQFARRAAKGGDGIGRGRRGVTGHVYAVADEVDLVRRLSPDLAGDAFEAHGGDDESLGALEGEAAVEVALGLQSIGFVGVEAVLMMDEGRQMHE